MDHSIYSASRKTHLKIVAVGLLSAAVLVAVGKFANTSGIDLGTAPLFKAGEPIAVSGQLPPIR
jgi:hypothetical protein